MLTINFEDNGQDFTHFNVDKEGVVNDCGLFQSWLWVGTKVVNHTEVKAGDCIELVMKDGYVLHLKHAVDSVQANKEVCQ